MVVGIVVIVVGLAMLALAWRAWTGAWRSWAAVNGPPWWNAPITTWPATAIFVLGLGIFMVGGPPVVGEIGLVLVFASFPLSAADPQWWGPRWYRTGDWPQPADGFGRRLGRYSAAWHRNREEVPGELTLEANQIVFVPAAESSGIGIPWTDVRGARAEDGSTLCIDARGPTRFTMSRPERAAKRIAAVAGARGNGATKKATAATGRRDAIKPL